MAWNAFPCLARSGAKPLVPFGKGNGSSQEGGNTGRRTIQVLPALGRDGRPFSSRPGSSGGGVYSGIWRDGKASEASQIKPLALSIRTRPFSKRVTLQ